MSNIVYTTLDSVPAVLSPVVVGKAREFFGDRVIITDDLWAVSVRQVVEPACHTFRHPTSDLLFKKLVKLAVRAGNDMLLITHGGKVAIMVEAIVECAREDDACRKLVDAAVKRIMKLKDELRMTDIK